MPFPPPIRRAGGPNRGRALACAIVVLLVSTFIVVVSSPPAEATHDYALVRLGRHATGTAVRGLEVSDDGRWVAAASSSGAVRLFDYDAGPPFDPVWTSADINAAEGGGFGSSHPLGMSADGGWISVGTEQTQLCADPNASGCLFAFRRTGGGSPAWSHGFSAPVWTTDAANAYVVAGAWGFSGRVAVFDLSGREYWNESVSLVQMVRITPDGQFLAVSAYATVRFYVNTGLGFALVWSRATIDRNVNIDLAEDGRALVAGEDDPSDLPGGSDFFMWAPGGDGWDAGDGTPCLVANQANDVYAVAIAPDRSNATNVRAIAGGTWGDLTDQFALCDAAPRTQWIMPVILAADTALAGCTAPTPCFSAFGTFDGYVFLAEERDPVVDSDPIGTAVQAVAMSPEAMPTLAAGSDAGDVYFYGILPDYVDYVPWNPAPAGEVRVGVGGPVTFSVSIRNQGGQGPRSSSVIAFANESAPVPFGTYVVPPVPPGSARGPFQAPWTAPSTPGVYRVVVDVDYGNAVLEGDETNNLYAFVLNVTAAPVTTLAIGAPQAAGPPTYVTSATPFSLTAQDLGDSGIASTMYRIDAGPWLDYGATGPFVLPTEGEHLVEYFSTDNLGAREAPRQATARVDDTPPTTSMGIGNPQYPFGGMFVTSSTPLSLVGADGGVTPVGLASTDYRVDGGVWIPYGAPFTLGGDGPHLVEYRSVDRLGNGESVQGLTVIVDDAPPSTSADVGTPRYQGTELFVTSSTPIRLPSVDGGVVPVGLNATEYRVDGGAWIPYAAPFTLGGEGRHTVEFRAWDLLGNLEAAQALPLVLDDTPPVTTPSHGDGTYAPGTTFGFTATDAGCGVARTEVRVDGGAWTTFAAPINFAEGSHVIHFRSIDRVNNSEADRVLTISISSEPPPPPIVRNPNWKPLVAFVFASILALVGAWSARRAPWPAGSRRFLRAFAFTALPFVVLEAATGLVSFLTGWLSIPPIVGVGTAVDVGILIAGGVVLVSRERRSTRPK